MRKTKVLLLLITFIMLGNSCKKEDILEVYSFGVFEFSSNAPLVDLQRINTYLDTKNLRLQETISAQKSKIDDMAKKSFDARVVQIVWSELDAEVVGTTTFSYAVVKIVDGQEVILKKEEFSFQQKF